MVQGMQGKLTFQEQNLNLIFCRNIKTRNEDLVVDMC